MNQQTKQSYLGLPAFDRTNIGSGGLARCFLQTILAFGEKTSEREVFSATIKESEENDMEKIRRWSAMVLAAMLAVSLLSGCKSTSGGPAATKDTEATQPAQTKDTEATQPENTEAIASLVSLRQAMVETPQRFAVAYLGYGHLDPTDPFALMREQAAQLCDDLPFLLQIPKENVVGTFGQLYSIIPLDENATVAVNGGEWNPDSGLYEYRNVLYRSEKGEPILLLCNYSGMEPDVQVTITDSDGTVTVWQPSLDGRLGIIPLADENGNCVFYDFSIENTGSDYNALVGTWELAWTEVEGDRVEIAPGRCKLEITQQLKLSLRDREFPEEDFANRELTVIPYEMYPDCGNNQWMALVSAEDNADIHYVVTLLSDGSLLMQQNWEMEGMPMVSYGWFQRVS